MTLKASLTVEGVRRLVDDLTVAQWGSVSDLVRVITAELLGCSEKVRPTVT